ncbi:MAG: GBS Bsp-like repeat-containing protein [Lachnospiraceae bacterium]|nr:GBS Bsp-like repeat-containing protein [Lachnospiraceae bacterium]
MKKQFRKISKKAVCLVTVFTVCGGLQVPVSAEEQDVLAGVQEEVQAVETPAEEETDTIEEENTMESVIITDDTKEDLLTLATDSEKLLEDVQVEEPVFFSLEAPEAVVEALDPGTGEFTVRIRGVHLQEGESLQVPIWRDSKQKDIIWNKAVPAGEDYIVKDSAAKHGYLSGMYHIHVYKRSSSGSMTYLMDATTDLSPKAESIEMTALSGDKEMATLKNVRTYGTVSQIRFAVWSKENGQDDIRWYTPADILKSDVSVEIPLSAHKGTGTYYVHVYAFTKTGDPICLQTTTFERGGQEPAVEAFSVQVSGESFRIVATNVTSGLGINAVQVPVWSKSDQSDIVWYTAVKEGNAYVVNSDISRHKNNRGTYHAHLYLKDANNKLHCIGKTDFQIAGTTTFGELSAEESADGNMIQIRLKGLSAAFSVKDVKFAVWSKENGQDDLVWYNAQKSGSDYVAAVNAEKHKTNGIVLIHTYLYGEDGKPQFLAAIDYEMKIHTENKVMVSEVNESEGSFKVTVQLTPPPSLKYVTVAIWSKSDQSDIKWYTAEKQADGTYTVRMNLVNHQGNTGHFYAHAYAYDTAGKPTLIGTATADLKSSPQIAVQKISEGEYRVTVNGRGCFDAKTEIQCPTWSAVGGQDDLKWYKAEKGSDGSFTCTILRSNHLHDGAYYTDVYAKDASGKMTMLKRLNYEMIQLQPAVFDGHAKEVMRNIIYAVETGGQVYGVKRYDAFTEAYANSSTETAITIGAGQWFATEAKTLLSQIRSRYPEVFEKYDTAEIGYDLDHENWKYYGTDGAGHKTILKGSEKALAIQNIISSPEGIAVQDSLIDEQMNRYVTQAEALGVTDLKAKLFCANIQHLGGYNAMVRVVNYCKNSDVPITMENMWNLMRANEAGSGNTVGADKYASRHKKVMQWLDNYL